MCCEGHCGFKFQESRGLLKLCLHLESEDVTTHCLGYFLTSQHS